MALGGVTSALAIVVMCLGGLIPVATYVCPAVCCVILHLILPSLKSKGAWVWYVSVSLLSLLLAPDKEAAAVFIFLGYYPILKPVFDRSKLGIVYKFLLFNISTMIMYALLIYIFGMEGIVEDFAGLGAFMIIVTLILGNVTFFLLDRAMGIFSKKFSRGS